MNELDFNPDEMEFRGEVAPALAQIRSVAGRCPPPDLLMAAVAGVPLEDADAIHAHVARCPVCAQLSRDLAEHEVPGASEAEDRRMRARCQSEAVPRRAVSVWSWLWRPLPVAAVCATLVVLIIIGLKKNSPAMHPAEVEQAVPTPSEIAPPAPWISGGVLALQKAVIKIPAAAVLIYRGSGEDRQAFLKDLAAALEPYRRDDYAEAARALAPLPARYPDSAEPAFYLGVSQLFLNQNDAAMESLQGARRHADATLRDDVSWYLAIAFERAGKSPEVLREVEALCGRAGEYKDKACAAVDQLKQR